MTGSESPGGPLDVATLGVIADRGRSHPLVRECALRPDALSPRRLAVRFDVDAYPATVTAARLDVCWYEGGDHSLHYVESRGDDAWQCRWDRHPKPDAPRAHFHPPPDASETVEGTDIDDSHPLGVFFGVLDRIERRAADLHER